MSGAATLRRMGLGVETIGDLLSDHDDTFRATHVGASEVAALFDCSPWLTRYELWMRKAGKVPPASFADDERSQWGVLLEPVILDEACRRYGWTVVDTPKRLSNGRGLGGHPDRFVRFQNGKIGPVEAKCVDWLRYKAWGDEPPLHYLLQPQTYCGLGNGERCAIVALVGGNQLEKWEDDFRSKLYSEVERRVDEFWHSIRAGKAPKPDYSRDGSTIGMLHSNATGGLIDLRLDNRTTILAAEFLEASAAKKAAEKNLEAIKSELLDKLGDHTEAMVEGYRVRVPVIEGSPDVAITQDMVGQIVPGRAPHRRFYIKEIE